MRPEPAQQPRPHQRGQPVPEAGLGLLQSLDGDGRMAGNHRLAAARAYLLEMTGDHAAARRHYLLAADGMANLPECRYLQEQAARLASE